ncbi:hypothetical protein LIA77_05372 [Sarocladium implicatum]|nr:hypothetical protein LIA77_05372 [Sarocladium implicatum]
MYTLHQVSVAWSEFLGSTVRRPRLLPLCFVPISPPSPPWGTRYTPKLGGGSRVKCPGQGRFRSVIEWPPMAPPRRLGQPLGCLFLAHMDEYYCNIIQTVFSS